MQQTGHPKIRIWKNIPMDRATLRAGIADLLQCAQRQDHTDLPARIKQLVPEYTPANNG